MQCLSQRIIALVRGPWSLLHYRHWALAGHLSGHPVTVLSHGDSVALSHRTALLPPPPVCAQEITDGVDIEMGQHSTLVLGLDYIFV